MAETQAGGPRAVGASAPGGEDLPHRDRVLDHGDHPQRPPQRGRADTSIANARRMRAAQAELRGGRGSGRPAAGRADSGLGLPVDHSLRPGRASGHGKPLHSTERAKHVTVHYRWHPLYGQVARVNRGPQRGRDTLLFCELPDGTRGPCPRG